MAEEASKVHVEEKFHDSNSKVTDAGSTQNSITDERVVTPDSVKKLLETAREILSRKDYGKALSYFAYIAHHAPSLSNQVHDDFLFALKSWNSILAEHGKMDDLVKCLEEAYKLFPNSAQIVHNVGSTLFQLNLFDDAAVYFRRALKLDPGLSIAEESLDSIANLLVERWHFRMLNDKVRNQAYKNAIDRAVKNGCDQVLDIGSGTGILSMFAVQSGANKVFACEMSKTMYDLSSDILSANQMQDSVHVINKKSHDLTIPEDLPRRVSLIVTETLDCGLLGEGIIDILTHAKRELLSSSELKADEDHSKTTQIIPAAATVYGQLIECEKIRNYSRVKSTVIGHDISSVYIRGAENSEKGEEPYTTEEVSCIDHTAISKPFHIMTYDFQTPENYIQERKHDLNVDIVKSGTVDAIVVWFELMLDSVETLSSAPGNSVCWEQAVYPCQLAEDERLVDVGDKVLVKVRLTSNAIFLDVDNKVTTHQAMKVAQKFEGRTITLPYPEISKLNNHQLSKNCHTALTEAFKKLQISSSPNKDKNTAPQQHACLVLSTSPTFNPLFALWSGFSPVLCVLKDTNFTECLKTLAGDNKALCFTDKPLEELAGTENWKVLVVDPIEPGGLLRQGVIEDIVLAKGCVLAKNTGIVLPQKIEVWGMLISSNSLCQKSHVTGNDVTLDLDIASHVNTFQVKNQIDVDLQSNPFDSLTDSCLLLTMDFMKPGDDKSLLSLLNVTCDSHMTAVKEGMVDGLMYWFSLGYTECKTLSTGPESASQFNQVVIMFKEKRAVVSGQNLLVRTSCKNSCVTATLETS